MTLLSGIVYTPIMLRLLGQSEYGLYQLVYSVVSYLGLLSFGFASSYLRFYSRFRAQDDDNGVQGLNGMFMMAFLFMAVVSLTCGFAMTGNIHFIFANGLTDSEYPTATAIMILMVVNLALSFPNSVFTCYTTACEQFVFQRALNLASALLNPFITLPLLIAGYGSVAMVLVSTGLTLISLIANGLFCLKYLNMQFRFRSLDWKLFQEVFAFTFFIFLNQIIDQVNWSVDRFLLGRLRGTADVAIYSVGATINTTYTALSTAISSVFAPQVNRIVANGKEDVDDCLTELMCRVGRIQFAVLSLVLMGFVFFGRPFVLLWGGLGYGESFGVALIVMVPMLVPLVQNVGIEIQRAKNKHQVRSVVYFAIAVVNVLISVPLIEEYGAIGGALGTAVGLTLGNILFMNWYYAYGLGLGIMRFWKAIASMLPGVILPCLVGMAITITVDVDRWSELLMCTMVFAMVYAFSMWRFGLGESERTAIGEPVQKRIKSFHSRHDKD